MFKYLLNLCPIILFQAMLTGCRRAPSFVDPANAQQTKIDRAVKILTDREEKRFLDSATTQSERIKNLEAHFRAYARAPKKFNDKNDSIMWSKKARSSALEVYRMNGYDSYAYNRLTEISSFDIFADTTIVGVDSLNSLQKLIYAYKYDRGNVEIISKPLILSQKKVAVDVGTGMNYIIDANVLKLSDCELKLSDAVTIIGQEKLNKDTNYRKTIAASIGGMQFDSTVYLINNHLINPVSFNECLFKKRLLVTNYDYQTWVPSFNNTIFERQVTFYNEKSQLGHDISFYHCVLGTHLSFANSIFGKEASVVFKECYLPDTLDFGNCRIGKIVDLTTTNENIEGHKCEINLFNSDISKLKLQYRNFHLYFRDSIANNPRNRELISSTYLSLLTNFRRDGFNDSFQALDTEYKDWQSHRDILMLINRFWWDYGYQKWRIVVYCLLFMIIFSIFNLWKFRQIAETYSPDKLVEQIKKDQPFARRYFYILLYTALIFFSFGFDIKNIKFDSARYVSLLLFQYTLGLVCTGFLISWVIK